MAAARCGTGPRNRLQQCGIVIGDLVDARGDLVEAQPVIGAGIGQGLDLVERRLRVEPGS